ncbi:CAP domain-containing protein [Aspergillus oleicola]
MRFPSIHQFTHPQHHPPLRTLLSSLLNFLLLTTILPTSALANPNPDPNPDGNIVTVLVTKTAIATEITTATATAGVVTATPKVPQDKSYISAKLFKSTVLEATNAYRKAYNASSLSWNNTLADFAKEWAGKCVWEHSGAPYGENLAYGYSTSISTITAWADEASLYDFKTPTGFSEETGHFTQLVWKSTRQVGCAAVNCGVTDLRGASGNGRAQGWYVVCEYMPGGNVVGAGERGVDKNQFFRDNIEAKVEKVNLSEIAGDGGDGDERDGGDGEDNGAYGLLRWRATGIWWWIGLLHLLTII